ncbi:glycosyltransferase family 4 protein [Pseudactinotalea sp. Z1732]|uniref:glycosyltransferase family 4 protein n=1 Tax=Micrococcales TaxID=85006 RepID=UPI003C7A5F69
MRLLLLSHYYPPEVGAPQRRWSALVPHLRNRGVRMNVITTPPHYPHGYVRAEHAALRPGTRSAGAWGEVVHRVRYLPYDKTVRTRGLDQVIAAVDTVRVGLTRFSRHRPDVIVATAPSLPTVLAGAVLGRLLGVPVVVEMRDAWPDLISYRRQWQDDESSSLSGLLATAAHHVVTWAQRRATALVTTSEAFAQRLRDRGMPPVHVIRTGTNQQQVPARIDHEGPLRVLYLGTVGRSQDLATAVRAAALLRQQGVGVQMRIVGDGALRPEIRELADQLQAPVTFLDPVSPAETATQYTWADTVLVSLRPWEPMAWTVPSKLLEVIGTGRHVTGALAGEPAQILTDAGAGHVVPPGDVEALAGLWRTLEQDRSLLDIGGSGAQWLAMHAREEDLAEHYLSLLQHVTTTARR